ncbi:vWA domain-containing protein [Streptomyces mirabilis]|uniref:vWA domain-containing protein n=1 Tax=Streptomyces mirabilis TaxID=68239 RepID=UPI0036DA8AA2
MTSCEEAADSAASPEVALEALAECREPFLIGVRHHSPALAAAVPGMLSAAAPEVLLIELPEEFAPWLEYLGDPATVPPVALAGSRERGGVVFLPFAEFSPELAAIRWAREAGVPVVPFDLPLAARDAEERAREVAEEPGAGQAGGGRGRLAAALRARAGGRTEDDLWARLVESGAPGAAPEELRRAALLVGWALRADTGEDAVDPYDLRREANMRGRLAEYAGRRTAAVIGAFHAPALLPAGSGPVGSGAGPAEDVPSVITSLVPYSYPLLDERSGYPAGIRDPEWQRGVFRAAGEPGRLDELLTATAVRICAAVREAGHPSGPADAREVVRVARDLATLRGLPAAGRGELVEAVQTVLTQGQLLGRGRVVAAAMERVLVGDRQGRLAPGTPRSGLGPAVEGLLAELSMPSPTAPARRELRLDALRSELDRRREICLRRMAVSRVPYGEEAGVAGVGDGAALTTRWTVTWTPSTAAMLDVTGVHGVTLEQAAGGVLARRRAAERRDGGPTAAQVLAGLEDAARCALPGLASERLTEVAELLPASGTLPELLGGLDLLSRIGAGHVPGLPAPWEKERIEAADDELGAAGVRALDGLTGSTDTADARALVDLATRVDGAGGGLRLADALGRLDEDGTPLIRGAAGAARVLLGLREATEFGTRLTSRVDSAVTPELRSDLAAFLRGTLLAAGPLLETGEAVDPLLERVESLTDRAFLDRLPALRAGFDVLAPAARSRMLAAVQDRTGHAVGELPDSLAEPGFLARMAAADLAGRTALATAGLDLLGTDPTPTSHQTPHDDPGVPNSPAAPKSPAIPNNPPVPNSLGPGDRWRLLLGRARQLTGRAGRIARALDELYGSGRGEGVGEPGDDGAGGGSEASFPDVRSWSEELAALFGPGVREEVLAAAADAGRVDALQELDPASARPSVELLRTVLSYAGGMPEQQLARLRPLVARLVKELTDALAHRLRPALAGLAHPRPTRRPGGPLDLARTVRANLATARRDPATGAVTVLPERPVFRTRARKAADWRLVLVVDVSGSMEASTIWAALTASVVAGVPALSTHFVAFSTEVVDLTDQVDDPLGLLLEVRVGGGTSIARGLRHARSLVTVPSRTLVVLISDFEEGGPVGPLLSEVRALVDSGCHVLGCASLDDAGRPRYSAGVAGQLVAAGMPVAALSPLELARWVGERMGGTHR